MKVKAAPHPAEPGLRAFALSFPEVKEDFPWGESAFKVKGKVFLFMRASVEGLGLSVKLPITGERALANSFAEPTGYGLGKSGWVSARFAANQDAPLAMLESWLEESYTAVAPKRLVKALAATPAKVPPKVGARKAPAKRTATKQPKQAPRKAAPAKPRAKVAKRSAR